MMSNGASKSRSDMELVTKNNMQPNLNQSKWDSRLIILIYHAKRWYAYH